MPSTFDKKKMGTGCPRCGSTWLEQTRHITGVGLLLIIAGLLFSIVTVGLSLVLVVAGFYLRVYRARCKACGWRWG